MHRATRILSIALITAGTVMLIDVGLTLVWTEPVSALYGEIRQSQAAGDLDELSEEFEPEADFDRAARQLGEQVGEGDAIGRIKIERTGTNLVFVEGTSTTSLQIGPGHYTSTGLPGEGETVGIAGHRTTYGAPFHDINELREGDEIMLEMPYGTFTYEFTGQEIVDPGDTSVLEDTGRETVVLTACHPLYSAEERIIVSARLIESSRT